MIVQSFVQIISKKKEYSIRSLINIPIDGVEETRIRKEHWQTKLSRLHREESKTPGDHRYGK